MLERQEAEMILTCAEEEEWMLKIELPGILSCN